MLQEAQRVLEKRMSDLTCPIREQAQHLADKSRAGKPCERPAREYEVKGLSFSVRQILCEVHRALAEFEGFQLVEVEKAVDNVQENAGNREITVQG